MINGPCVLLHMIRNCTAPFATHGLIFHTNICLNPRPRAAYMRQWTGSSLFQIMASRLFGANPLSIGPLGTNFSEILKLFIHEDAFDNIVCKMAAIFFQGKMSQLVPEVKYSARVGVIYEILVQVSEKYKFTTVINKLQTQTNCSAEIYFHWLQDLDDTKRQSNTTTDFSWVSQTLLTLIDFATKDVDLTVFSNSGHDSNSTFADLTDEGEYWNNTSRHIIHIPKKYGDLKIFINYSSGIESNLAWLYVLATSRMIKFGPRVGNFSNFDAILTS